MAEVRLEDFEIPKEELIGKKLCALIKCEYSESGDCPIYQRLSETSLKDNQSINNEIVIENSTGKRIIDASYSIISHNTPEIEGFVVILRDITAYKEIESQKETFVATLTHDLKTPIRAEIRALELLLKGNFGTLTPEQIDIMQDTLYSSKYMFAMVDNLLSTYRYENGNIVLKKDKTDLNQLIKSCQSELKHLTNDKKQEVIFDFQEKNLAVRVDTIEIKRVIMNLLSNAISYTQQNGKIIIKTEFDDEKIKLSFIDNGKGISKEDIAGLFNKYTSYAKKFRQVGTGLGLYLCKQVITAHGGEIFVESQKGKGSTFSFIIPVKNI